MPQDDPLTFLLAIFTGLGLAAACGFRTFIPLLAISIGSRVGQVDVADGFAWLGSTTALVCFAVATALEVAAYYVPVLDNLLDTLATPAAAIAGAVLATSVLVDLDPWMRWTLGIVAGAGIATAVQVPTAAMRGGSTVTTAGTANPVVATGELLSSTLVSAIAVVAPVVIPIILIALVAGAFEWRRRRRRRHQA